jgi:hypothetical protein
MTLLNISGPTVKQPANSKSAWMRLVASIAASTLLAAAANYIGFRERVAKVETTEDDHYNELQRQINRMDQAATERFQDLKSDIREIREAVRK